MEKINYEVRKLTEEDRAEATAIFQSARKVMRSTVDRSSKEIEDYNDPNVHFVGAFYQDELIAFMKYNIWPKIPSFNVGNMNIKSGVLQRYDFSNENHPILPLMDAILEDTENRKLYTWYYNRSLTAPYHKLQLEGKDLLKRCNMGYDHVKQQYRYERFVEEVIPAGQLAVNYGYRTMLQANNIYDHDFMVVKCCLKNEYRDTPDYFDDTVIEECLKNIKKIKST